MDTIFIKDHPPVRHEGGGCQGAGLGEGEVRFKGVLCHLMPWRIDLSEIMFCVDQRPDGAQLRVDRHTVRHRREQERRGAHQAAVPHRHAR